MDIKEKQAIWLKEKPLFEAELIHSYLLPFFHFNENTGDYEFKSESINNTDEEDRKVAYESLNTGWAMWLRAKRAKAQAVPEGFVLVPKELSDGKADAQALLAWGCHAGLFKSQNWDMSALRVEEFRLKWCKSKARELQEEYRVAIKAQEQGHD